VQNAAGFRRLIQDEIGRWAPAAKP
jgi:hypothetical protein